MLIDRKINENITDGFIEACLFSRFGILPLCNRFLVLVILITFSFSIVDHEDI